MRMRFLARMVRGRVAVMPRKNLLQEKGKNEGKRDQKHGTEQGNAATLGHFNRFGKKMKQRIAKHGSGRKRPKPKQKFIDMMAPIKQEHNAGKGQKGNGGGGKEDEE